jgi:DNA-binding GntR family transcriptional regulator
VSLKDTLDLFDVRAGLAHIAGRLAVTRAMDAQIFKVTKMHEDLTKARDCPAHHAINSSFHAALLDMT